MAKVTRGNPAATATGVEMVGADITFFTIDYINAINGSAGAEGAQAAVLRVINTMHTIVAAGPLHNSNTEQTFAIEGPLFTPLGGTTLQAQIRALGTVDSVNLASSVVTAKDLSIGT